MTYPELEVGDWLISTNMHGYNFLLVRVEQECVFHWLHIESGRISSMVRYSERAPRHFDVIRGGQTIREGQR